MRTRRLALLVLLLPAVAVAGEEQSDFDVHGFQLAPGDLDLADPLSVWRPEVQVPGSWSANGQLEYARQTVMATRDSEGDAYALPDLPTLPDELVWNLGGQYALHERVAIAPTLPLLLANAGEGDGWGLGVGDLRIYVPVTLLAGTDEDGDHPGPKLSLIPYVDVPLGASCRFFGNGGPGGGMLAAVGTDALSGVAERGDGEGPLRLSLNVGMGGNRTLSAAVADVYSSAHLLTGAAVSWVFSDQLAVGVEATLSPELVGGLPDVEHAPGEVLGTVRGSQDAGFRWDLGGATSFTAGAGTADWRVFGGFGFTWGKGDRDGDGFVDAVDTCPEGAESANAYADDDGCPDELGVHRLVLRGADGAPVADAEVFVDGSVVGRTDHLGIFEHDALIPGSTHELAVRPPEAAPLAPPTPIQFTAAEGATESTIDLGWKPGSIRIVARSQDGPLPATVEFVGPAPQAPVQLGEGGEALFVLPPGEWTLLIRSESFGTERRQVQLAADREALAMVEVQLEPAVVELSLSEVQIDDEIQFAFDRAAILPASQGLLEEVARTLVETPEIKAVQVQGHSDDRGAAGYNLRLSQRRVDAVVERLVELGVPPERLQAVGYGESCPVADNGTEDGRSRNRRVQFIVTDPAPPDGVPCQDGPPPDAPTP